MKQNDGENEKDRNWDSIIERQRDLKKKKTIDQQTATQTVRKK